MAIKKAVGVHTVGAILLAFVCLAGVGQGQEKPDAKKPEKAEKPKAEKPAKVAKGKAAVLQLDEKARKRVKDNPEIAALVTLRNELDELFAEYRSLGLTKGVKAHEKATRKLPSLGNRVVKARDKLAALTDRQLGPAEKDLEKAKEREGKLIRKMDKTDGKGTEKTEKALDDLRTEIGELENTADLLALIGKPEMPVVPAQTMLLEELLKPNDQEEPTLRSLIKKHGDLMAGRLMILHLQADLKQAREGTKDTPANPERAKATERQLAQVEKKFTKYFLNIWAPIAKQRQELLDEREELQQKVARLTGRPAAKKHGEKLAAVERKLDADKRTNALYERIARGTLAEKELAEQAKEEDKGKDTEEKRPRKRKRER